jgi:hypothetical protein
VRDQRKVQRRDVHVKMHALVRAEFTVADDLPLDLRLGLFARPTTYKAWVRFSNSNNEPQADRKRDIRGMAVKVMGVPGRKELAAEVDAQTHDFVLISAPVFPSSTPGQFDELAAAILGNLAHRLFYFLTHPRVALVLFSMMKKHANILQIPYFSAVPYRFGTQAVKYVATPRVEVPDKLPSYPRDDFLREAAAAQLSKGDAVFDLAVQFQRDEASMPIEDPSRAWSPILSPPRKVASVRIPKQDFDRKAIDDFGENLSFTPWHCLPEHRPLGAINRARKVIYETLSIFRHRVNGVVRAEPEGGKV